MLPHCVKETRAFAFNRIIEDGENSELNQNVEDGKSWALNLELCGFFIILRGSIFFFSLAIQ